MVQIPRHQTLKTRQSFFLFGARGTGKAALLKCLYPHKDILWIDLLNHRHEKALSKNPDQLLSLIRSRPRTRPYKKVIIDEIQKAPKLLDVIQQAMGQFRAVQFIMTGSSARKLKRGQANLLAGRAVTYNLYPLSCFELGEHFRLLEALQFGGLPQLFYLKTKKEKMLFLESYVQTYLKEEILQEQVIRQVLPFKNFLEIAAQLNGQTINYSKFSRETGVDYKTIQNYFFILEDTLAGFFLPAFHRSVRKQYQKAPKFYLFDLGVTKALENTIHIPLKKSTFAFGRAFEHFLILECYKLNHYFQKRQKFFYYKTANGLEIDLIIKQPGKKEILVEIKSTTEIRKEHIKTIKNFSADWTAAHQAQVWSLDPETKNIQGVLCLPWQRALKKLYGRPKQPGHK